MEAKGGYNDKALEGVLGQRRSADNREIVQQGTRKYLESVAQEMQEPTNSKKIRDQGLELETALGENRVEYYLIRQSFNEDGSLATPTFAQFDLSKR